MEYARGKETEPFAWCIRAGRARMAEGSPYPGFHRVFSYVERGFYGRQLARALGLFPREQILILSSDRLQRDPDAVLADIARFLGVPGPAVPVVPRVSRPAATIDYPSELSATDVAYLQRQFAAETTRFHALAGTASTAF
jgi:hypothetical protein